MGETFICLIAEIVYYTLRYCFLWIKYGSRKKASRQLQVILDEEQYGERKTLGVYILQAFVIAFLLLLAGFLLVVIYKAIFSVICV